VSQQRQQRGSADCNSSSNDEDIRNHKIAKLLMAATAAKLVLSMHSVSQSTCFLQSKHVHKHCHLMQGCAQGIAARAASLSMV